MENLTSCPVCGNTALTHELTCIDYVAGEEEFKLQRCSGCSLLFTNPRPTSYEIGRYYASERYVSHAGNKSGIIYRIYDLVRDYSIRKKIRLIKKFHTTGNLMDLGCGLGYFLHGVKQDGSFRATGVDISEDAVKFVKSRFGYDVLMEDQLDTLGRESFDVITQWHVLEHVHLLNERVIQLKRLLKPGGTLFIAVPNSSSFDAHYYREFWDAYDVPRHLYHFNQESFNLLMKKHGFRVTDVRPLIFDAPYVSMRSETHRKKSFPFVRGGLVGTLSNIRAMATRNYSSLLYIVKHEG